MTSLADRATAVGPPLLWASLALTAGDAVAGALDGRSAPVQAVAATVAWGLWTVGLVTTLVPRTSSLTVVRFVVPAGLPAVAWAVVSAGDPGALEVAAVTTAAALAAGILTPAVGHRWVNGSSYGDEQRYLLRAPLPVLFGPLELVWVAAVVGAGAGPLLLAARQWVLGGVALVVGWAAVWAALRITHVLSRRWLVLVPAGIVVHAPMALVDTLLVQRADLARVGPAPADTDATDLTLGAAGLAVELELAGEVDVLPLAHQRGRSLGGGDRAAVTQTAIGRTLVVERVLVTPTRPGALLRAAAARGLTVG